MYATTLIDLLRHGETQGGTRFRGSTDDPLTPTGWTQLRTTTDQNETRWDRIITSPSHRCADFAIELGETRSIPVIQDKRFQELHFGCWEGRTVNDLLQSDADALSRFWNDPISNTPPQAEPLQDFQTRVLSGWREIIAKCMGDRILLVSHGGVIRLLFCHILQIPLQQLLDIEVHHAALYRIRLEHQDKHAYTAMVETAI